MKRSGSRPRIKEARDAGATWAAIGAALCITRQAAQQRYTHILNDQRPTLLARLPRRPTPPA